MKKDKLQRPEYIFNEVSNIEELQSHFDHMKRVCLQRHLFHIVFNIDKTLFALVSGALTGLSTNVLTGFLDLSDYLPEEVQLHVMQLLLALIFNCSFILFSAKVIQIQESGLYFILPESPHLTYQEIRKAQYNIVYCNCMQAIRYLRIVYIISLVSGVLTIASFLFGNVFLQTVKEAMIWLICLLMKLVKW